MRTNELTIIDSMNILIADDHALYRSALVQVVQQLADQVAVVEAHNWQTALEQLAAHPDLSLAVLDLNMPGMESFEGLATFLELAHFTPVVIVSGSENLQDMRRVLDAGAMGYIAKSESTPILLSALALVLSGGIYIPPRLIQNKTTSQPIAPKETTSILTPRQLEVLQAIAHGKSNKQIAQEMGLSVATVKAHVSAIFKTLNVSKRFEAIHAANHLGLGK